MDVPNPVEEQPAASSGLTETTAEIVEAYLARNKLPPAGVPGLIAAVHGSLLALGRSAPRDRPPVPPVPIRKTVTPDYLVSLEDGRHYRTLRRHLSSRGLTPEAYRARWGLPIDYPMVAETYRARRSELARELGLGQSRGKRNGKEDDVAKPGRRKPKSV